MTKLSDDNESNQLGKDEYLLRESASNLTHIENDKCHRSHCALHINVDQILQHIL